MGAPSEIVALLESVIGIFLTEIRHRERAAFILADELVEVSCKTRALEHNHQFNTNCGFHAAWNAPGVGIDPATLGARVQTNRNTRNLMQHGSAAATVDQEHCANAIRDAVEVVERCWPGAGTNDFRPWVVCAVRIVWLYSSQGDPQLHQTFEDTMRDHQWNGAAGARVAVNEVTVRPGLRGNWQLAVVTSPGVVEELLNTLGVP